MSDFSHPLRPSSWLGLLAALFSREAAEPGNRSSKPSATSARHREREKVFRGGGGGADPSSPGDDGLPDGRAALKEWNDSASALVSRIAHGDRDSLTQLYGRYSRFLYALLMRVLHDPDEAEDALQEAFVKVWRLAHRFDATRGSATSWLATLARHLAIDRVRAAGAARHAAAATREDRDEEPRVDDKPHPDALSALEEDREAVRAILFELGPEQRIAIELAFFDGLTQTEIAEKLEQPLGTVKTRMRTGLAKLREKLRARFGSRP